MSLPRLDALGLLDLPPGRLATLVTTLEMRAPPPPQAVPDRPDLLLRRVPAPETAWYRRLYRAVGADWLWFSRLGLDPAALRRILDDPAVEVSVLEQGGQEVGLLELDFRELGVCELAFFGLIPQAIGSGAGRWLMTAALASAWRPGIARVWVHTCHFDHPRALDFYRRSGFVPCRLQIELFDDPRLLGLLPRHAAPQVPLLGSAAAAPRDSPPP